MTRRGLKANGVIRIIGLRCRQHYSYDSILFLLLLFLASCSTTRYVPDDELLLRSVKVRTVGDYPDVNTSALKGYIRQQPNARLFSLFPLPLATYSLAGRDTTRWINRTLRNLGEPPVLFDSLKAVQALGDLRQQLRNEG